MVLSITVQYPTKKPTLQFGACGQIVKEMQKALNQRLIQLDTVSISPLSVPTTGYFDRETKDAVKYLQCLAFLTIDGIVGEKTWAYLCNGFASLPILSFGSTGTIVKAVQEAFKVSGYYFGVTDGIFGVKTETAVRAFQEKCFLVSDGIIEPFTWSALSKLDSHSSRCSVNAFRG
ncbi:peptidoglycan-binding protein [Brasilonema sp. UFV-L1]|uniref:peptidoglycan-binding domain-containing protein n=1 Tax=Brasilonema sp. UFV-L1 TaxID=2234130 RepID=UPI00145D41B4|nr:peptidoglycan-binding protein [Brasilonema sp. UFV-L1]NMG10389.1 peptidoglycan-binding protein [Brasilonema sp. UFV-L1]